ncbi:MAG TPA: hypothetical protein VGR81_00870 [Candidatus Acidoferrales bacterium]|nr:hypothetical protein [Candidatus Acidoferrales bacterium]
MPVRAQNSKTPYPNMAPISQYMMADRNAEIALARTAAPESISRDAEILVLGAHGYETAVKGTNGFVCVVERSWRGPFGDPEFWNPKIRAPICYNPPAARSILPAMEKRQEMLLAGLSKNQVIRRIEAAFDKKELSTPETASMCYMMSKEAYDGDHKRPLSHLMFEVPPMDGATWGAGLPDSPVIQGWQDVSQGAPEPMTEFIVPVAKWSDGTPAEGNQ